MEPDSFPIQTVRRPCVLFVSCSLPQESMWKRFVGYSVVSIVASCFPVACCLAGGSEHNCFVWSPIVAADPVFLPRSFTNTSGGFPYMEVPNNGWLRMENLKKMDDVGIPPFQETSNASSKQVVGSRICGCWGPLTLIYLWCFHIPGETEFFWVVFFPLHLVLLSWLMPPFVTMSAQFTIRHFAFRVFPSKHQIVENWDTQKTNKHVDGRSKLTNQWFQGSRNFKNLAYLLVCWLRVFLAFSSLQLCIKHFKSPSWFYLAFYLIMCPFIWHGPRTNIPFDPDIFWERIYRPPSYRLV